MKRILFIFLLISSNFLYSQVKTTSAAPANKPSQKNLSAISANEINLLNLKDFNTVINDKLYRPKDYDYILQQGYVGDMLTHLGNNYYHLTGEYVGETDQNYLLKNTNGNLSVISDAVRQMLNDSLIILDSGKIFNLFTEKYIESKTSDKYLRIFKSEKGNRLYLSTEGVGVNSQNFRSFAPIKSDIVKIGPWEYGRPVGEGFIRNRKEIAEEGDDFVYDISDYAELNKELFYSICSDTLLSHDILLDFESNNCTSKYILFQNRHLLDDFANPRFYLINRYDLSDFQTLFKGKDWNFKPHRDGTSNDPPIVYNDSLLIFTQSVSDFNHSFYPFNKEINIDYNVYFSSNKGEFSVDINDWNKVNYFMNKYNGGAIVSKTDKDQFKILNGVYNNLVENELLVIVVYNYKTNKIVSVLDRIGNSFTSITKILLDNSNQILVVNDKKGITLFDMKQYNQIVSFKAILNNIDKDNNLTYNLKSKEIAPSKDKNNVDKNLSFFYTNLNKLYVSNNYTSKFKYKNYTLNEFTIKEEFEKINYLIDSSEKANFFNQTPNTVSYPVFNVANNKVISPENSVVIKKLSSLYDDWYSSFDKIKRDNPVYKREFEIELEYENYNIGNDVIQLKSKNLFNKQTFDTLSLGDLNVSSNSSEEIVGEFKKIFPMSNFEYLNTDYEKDNENFLYSIKIAGIGAENAKKIKDKSLSIKIKINLDPEYVTESIAPFERAFVKRKLTELKSYFEPMKEDEARKTHLLYSYFLNSGYKINKSYSLIINKASISLYNSISKTYVFEIETN